MASTRIARNAGAFYALTIVGGIFSEFVTTAGNAVDAQTLYRCGIGAGLVCLAAYLAVTILLYELFKPAAPRLSRMAAAFSLVGIAVLCVAMVPLIAALGLTGNDSMLRLALHVHGQAYLVADVFFGIYCLLIGVLIAQTRMFAVWIAALMAVAGAGYLLDSFAAVLAPGVAAIIGDYALLPGLVGEGALTLSLLFGAIGEEAV